ncbi:3',5'-cyclic-AMP phosphodiesterase [Neiella marina]|uniref:3',5'-cyclic adenosine monophosphate phosphodiesterase CpdA n=1 Tax=Neiella holothuriorum TaxID=2870530 RepID=A0ABS7EBU2_9GAMM|nr:3',5'-cyclic-AMP phosphodiesterase [Neiella holothuriorum]MBW8189710.1 3',5'-cyclic-AMP phosphodiesterase [Neiella holothuriorum]
MNTQDYLTLQASEAGPLRILQITDTHLFGDPAKELLGVNTRDSFEAVLKSVKADNQAFDLVVVTGDISQDDSPASYQVFAEAIATLAKPIVWLPGNHDDGLIMPDLLSAEPLSSVDRVLTEHWQLLMLNSQVRGFTFGELAQQQLDFVSESLTEYPDRYTLVFVHHNPVPMGCRWLDQHRMKNGESLLSLLSAAPNARGVVWGHVHQDWQQNRDHLHLIATPSTCIQFKPRSEQFALDKRPPGYRYLTLNPDGQLLTELKRLPDDAFVPDLRAQGY